MDVPLYKIKQHVHTIDFDRGVPARHEPIIDKATWHLVQAKREKPGKVKVCVDEAIPLRGLWKYHRGAPSAGALSRSKSGKYF